MRAALHRCAFWVMTSTRPFRGSPAAQAGTPNTSTNPIAKSPVATRRRTGAVDARTPEEALDTSTMPHLLTVRRKQARCPPNLATQATLIQAVTEQECYGSPVLGAQPGRPRPLLTADHIWPGTQPHLAVTPLNA